MKENECQGCSFSNRWRDSSCGAEAQTNLRDKTERKRGVKMIFKMAAMGSIRLPARPKHSIVQCA